MSAGRPEGTYGEDTAYLMRHASAVIDARRNGESCRSIAIRYGVPEHTVHTLMRKTGNAGRFRARAHHRRRERGIDKSNADILAQIEAAGDEVVIERLADDSGWIVTIDDLTGDPHERITAALRSAFEKWRA